MQRAQRVGVRAAPQPLGHAAFGGQVSVRHAPQHQAVEES